MSSRPTDLQIKKFWEKLGWEEIEPLFLMGEGFVSWEWHGVVDANSSCVMLESLPPIDPNNLFKYAVPKIRALKYPIIDKIYFARENGKEQALIIWWTGEPKTDTYGCGVFSGEADTVEDALFWAIWEIIEGTKQ